MFYIYVHFYLRSDSKVLDPHYILLISFYTDIAPDSYIAVFRDTVKISDASYTSHFEKINSYIAIRRSSDNPAKIDFVYKHFLNGYTGKFDHYLSNTSEGPQRLNILNKIKSFQLTPSKQMLPGGLARLSSRTKLATANKSKYYYNTNCGTVGYCLHKRY
ncbi:hypothetical protein BB560_001199 [Smittium megazygosporum]|uniref:Uncharacterized protein n=1 Tax=Smittium megazygosporum TaxID=133381 RepID=A0A2T9ZI88_9FUNG|nr:hypothetical protein BB560_001199 [Smittium megazygosporum]